MCPVAPLLALAISDGALLDVKTIEDLWRIRNPGGSRVQRFRLDPYMTEVPVFRRSDGRGKSISDHKILQAIRLGQLMEDLGNRAGYFERFTPYCTRRSHGNVIDRKPTHPTFALALHD